jgi:aspartate kinase
MKVVVQKFGGTCVESNSNQLIAAERIMEARDRGLHPVVVVSAMGREGQPYSTVELVKMVSHIHPHIEPRELDLLMSCGEIISTVALAHLLRTKGYETIALSGGQAGLITDEHYGHAHIVRIQADTLLQALQDGYMVFVAGFQGITSAHQITTLGAGGSDYTAVALTRIITETPRLPFGEDLEVAPLQVWKEVDGIMTANPHSLDDQSLARTIPQLTYDECVSMSRLGAEVLQQQAAEMARKYRIPVNVRNFRETDKPSTHIGSHTVTVTDDRVTAVVDQPKLLVFDLSTDEERLGLQIAERLERRRLTFFQVDTDAARTRFAVRPLKYRDVEQMVSEVIESRGAEARLNSGDFALVSIVGEALRQRLDAWQEQAERVLTDAGIELHGSSRDEISLSYLVGEADRKQAVERLHRQLVL